MVTDLPGGVVAESRRQRIPDWLIGLLIALVVVTVAFTVFGVGDDPSLREETSQLGE